MSTLSPPAVGVLLALLTLNPAPRLHLHVGGPTGITVRRALEGATRRLSTPACQRLFDDFTDQSGRRLALILAARSSSAAALLSELHFVSADDSVQCRSNDTVAVFTSVGSRVVHVCEKRFGRFAANPTAGEVLLIHELLHVLGLGENPPTSAQITAAVMNRCR